MEEIIGAESPYEEFLTTVDPENRDHWLKKFNTFSEGRFNLSWNWPSFFFGPWRYFAKGMSLRAVLYMVPFIMVGGFIETTLGKGSVSNFLTGFAIWAFYATMGSDDYFKFCRKYRDNVAGARKAKKIGKINMFLFILGPVLYSITVALQGVPGG